MELETPASMIILTYCASMEVRWKDSSFCHIWSWQLCLRKHFQLDKIMCVLFSKRFFFVFSLKPLVKDPGLGSWSQISVKGQLPHSSVNLFITTEADWRFTITGRERKSGGFFGATSLTATFCMSVLPIADENINHCEAEAHGLTFTHAAKVAGLLMGQQHL